MTKSISHSPKLQDYLSLSWHSSEIVAGVRFAVRRISLLQRIELNRRVRELTMKNEFLRAGDATDQVDAALADLLVARLYLEWGLEKIESLLIDGEIATVDLLISNGPEDLSHEIVRAIQQEIALSDDERKN
jgi:hypothetical protein